ncbi:hypothetical protein [Bacillus phage SDFMU_Pbc]|uniref:Uncharacterized protein n=1 Tax=Bacillus phage SDFMU_Pbc TaxID=3076135 RepID=A0AA96R0Z7_9CAUD|nr:hypothetical protein [Bacillus phage SDFMU_Pbc]
MTKEANTIWRITEEDIRIIARDQHPNASEKAIENVVNDAHKHFNMPEWVEAMEIFIENYIEEEGDDE